jgi:hypothetical protein
MSSKIAKIVCSKFFLPAERKLLLSVMKALELTDLCEANFGIMTKIDISTVEKR